jgi:hypothetical protein
MRGTVQLARMGEDRAYITVVGKSETKKDFEYYEVDIRIILQS